MTAELVLSVFVLLVLAFVGGHQLAVHRMTMRRKIAVPTLEDECAHQGEKLRARKRATKVPPVPYVVGGVACDDVTQPLHIRPATEADIVAAKNAGRYFDEICQTPVETYQVAFRGLLEPPRLRKPSRGNGHETPYARKKRAAKPKGKA